ncbi:MAG: SRPBCC family protein [Hyphomicrobiales bacterium]
MTAATRPEPAPPISRAGDCDFVISRDFDAPRELVFKCWTDPGHMARWWGPEHFTNPVCEMDVRPGGTFRIVMRGPDGKDYPMKGVFREIVPPALIVKSDDLSENSDEWFDLVLPDRPKGQGKPKIDLLTTVTFEDLGGKTRVAIRTRFEQAAIRDAFLKVGMREGWSGSLDKLANLLDAIKHSDREIIMTRLLDAPRELVFRAFTDPDNIGKWWGPNGFSTTTHAMDVRVGGVWRFTMHGPDGTDYPNRVVYTEIRKPERIAYDHYAGDEGLPHFKAVVTLDAEGAKTKVTLRLIAATAERRDGFVAFGAVEGGLQTLSRLAAYLDTARNKGA